METEKIKRLKLHYIIGMGRSGTTLLSAMLNSSEEVLALPEIYLTMYYYFSKSRKKYFSMPDIKDIYRFRDQMEYFRKISFSPVDLKADIEKINSYSDFLRYSFYSVEYPEKSNKNINFIIDKNPIYTFYIKEILTIFPEAKFVALIRDPRAFVNSYLEKTNFFEKRHSVLFYIYVWRTYAEQIIRAEISYPGRFMFIRYEDLITEPQRALQKICSFLEIPFQQQMLEHYKKGYNLKVEQPVSENAVKERLKNKYEPLAKPVNTERMESWKKNISSKDLSLINFILGKIAQRLGYSEIGSEKPPTGTVLSRKKYQFLVFLYFSFARIFYRLPIGFREIIRKKV